ncbi:MoaD/ThiS family protein [Nitratifractor sp.]
MVRVEFLGPIGREPMEAEVSSLAELSKLLYEEEELRKWLEKCAVAVNDVMVKDPDLPLKDGDRVSILPPVCGG